MTKRIAVPPDKLPPILKVWFRDLPPWVFGKDPAYEKLRAQKRHDPTNEPDPRRMIADLIAAKFAELGWEISYEESRDIFSGDWPITPYKKDE